MSNDASYDYLSSLLNDFAQSESIDAKLLAECLEQVEEFAFCNGFSETQLHDIWQNMLKLPMPPKKLGRAISLILPRETVKPETIDFLIKWIHENSHSPKRLIVQAILNWLTAAVRCRIINSNEMKHCYYTLIVLLVSTDHKNEIAHLLYYLTEPQLVTPFVAKRLLAIRNICKNNVPCYLALLSLVKRLKPHLFTDDSIAVFDDDSAELTSLSPEFFRCMGVSRDRQGLASPRKLLHPKWRLQNIAFKRPERGCIVYVSELTLNEAIREAKMSEIFYGGTTIDALMSNPFGFVFLAFASRRFHGIFMKYVGIKLEEMAFDRNDDSFRKLLTHLGRLQTTYGQPFGVVDRFLKQHFHEWKGNSYVLQMFALLSHVIISDYGEVFDGILTPLYKLNLKIKEPVFAQFTIRSMARCLINNVNYLAEPQILNLADQQSPSREAILQFDKSFRHICHLFANAYPNNSAILHEIADSYIFFLTATAEKESPLQSLLPDGIAHKILINSDFILINKFSRILIMAIDKHKQNDSDELSNAERQLDDMQMIKFGNILQSRIFNGVIEFREIDEQITRIVHIRKSFRARYNLSFAPLAWFDAEHKLMKEFDKAAFKQKLDEYCKYFTELNCFK